MEDEQLRKAIPLQLTKPGKPLALTNSVVEELDRLTVKCRQMPELDDGSYPPLMRKTILVKPWCIIPNGIGKRHPTATIQHNIRLFRDVHRMQDGSWIGIIRKDDGRVVLDNGTEKQDMLDPIDILKI